MRFRIRFLIKNKIDEEENVISHSNRHTTSTKWLKLVAMLFEVFHRGGVPRLQKFQVSQRFPVYLDLIRTELALPEQPA